jgi:2-haloalkanoic acid dehalogenase type II
MKLADFKALSFDCYGTLIDWETGIVAALQPLVRRSGTKMSREELLEAFGRFEHEIEEEHPSMLYSEVLMLVHQHFSELLGVDDDQEERNAFGRSVGDWPAFPDSAEALQYLKQHFRLIILSNVDRESFKGSNARLGVEFDCIFTAQDIGSYKPSLRNFHYMLDRLRQLGLEKSDLLHVAQSLFHDHVPANQVGIASAWIDRRHDKDGGGATVIPQHLPHFDFRFTSLGELAAAHQSESANA